MRRILAAFLLVHAGIANGQQIKSAVWQADNGDGTYKNPVIHADYSDPDAVDRGGG